MWFWFAALAGMLYTGEILLGRFLLRDRKDAWAFSFFYSLVGTIVALPFMLYDPHVPSNLNSWLLGIVVGVLIVGHNFSIFKASNHLEASLVGAITKLRLVWIFVLSIILLGAVFSWSQFAGTIFAILAGLVIIRRFKRPKSIFGVLLVLISTVLAAFIIILSKYLLHSFNAVSLTFFVTFLPATVLNFILMPHANVRIKKLFRNDWRIVLSACGLGAFANLALNQALSLNEANKVIVISEIFLVLVLAGEHILLKEKEQLWIKLLAISFAVAGAILIQVRF